MKIHFLSSPGRAVVLALLCGSMSIGCLGAGDGQEDIGQTQEGLARSVYAWGTSNYAYTVSLGSSVNQTCFLSGVAGNLNSGFAYFDYYTYPPTSNVSPSMAMVVPEQNGSQAVYAIWSGGGTDPLGNLANTPVMTHVNCVATAANRITANFGAEDDVVDIGAVTPNRQCFLSGVWGSAGTWTSPNAYVTILNDGKKWYMQGNLYAFDGRNNHAGATAVCFDKPAGTWSGSWTASVPDPGTATANIAYDTTGMVCGLTSIQGHFTANDFTDGVLINPPATYPGEWTITIKNGKKASFTCLQ